jgi:hypothetical protein
LYQKCGFRLDHVRHDYFWYYRTPHFENGIQIRDMLVFRYDLQTGPSKASAARPTPHRRPSKR